MSKLTRKYVMSMVGRHFGPATARPKFRKVLSIDVGKHGLSVRHAPSVGDQSKIRITGLREFMCRYPYSIGSLDVVGGDL